MKTTPFTLTKREAMVIAMRFGLAGHRDHTLEEVGQQHHESGAIANESAGTDTLRGHAPLH